MRILQVVPHYVPAYRFGGPLRVAHSLGIALTQQGHEITVCTTNLATEKTDLNVPIGRETSIDDISVYYEAVPTFRKWGLSPGLWQRLKEEIDDADIVLVHAHYQFANWAGAFLARRAAKPYVVFAHSSLRSEAISHKNTWIKRAYLRILEQENLTQALFIAFNAPEEWETSLFRENGHVIPNGIDVSNFRNLPSENAFRLQYPELLGKTVFLFLGRLDISQKGLDLLLPAFFQLYQDNHAVHLVLAGPDEDRGLAKLKEMARNLNLEQAITFTGLITGVDKLAALQDADVFVLPSRFEGGSVALLEGLYMGLPMLVSEQVGMWHEVVSAKAGLATKANIKSIADGLLKLAMEDVRIPMRGRGKNLILSKYTWDRIAKDMMMEIDALLTKDKITL